MAKLPQLLRVSKSLIFTYLLILYALCEDKIKWSHYYFYLISHQIRRIYVLLSLCISCNYVSPDRWSRPMTVASILLTTQHWRSTQLLFVSCR